MAELYYAKRSGTSADFVAFVLKRYYGYDNVRFSRNENGKPFCDAPLEFSLSHTDDFFFLGVSENEIGTDAENMFRRGNFDPIIARLSAEEQRKVASSREEFLKLWTMREATAKYLSMPVFASLKRLCFLPDENGNEDLRPVLDGAPLNVTIERIETENCFVCLCMRKNEKIETIVRADY